MKSARQSAALALSASAIVGLVAACGGGGGGGGGGGAGGGPQSGLTYSGNTNAAVITGGNASKLTADVMGGSAASAATSALTGVAANEPTPSYSRTDGLGSLGRRLYQSSRTAELARTAPRSSALSGASVDRTEPCDSGSVHVVGNVNDATRTGTISVTFISCRTGADTLNGEASLRIDAFDLGRAVPTDMTLSVTRASLSTPDINVDIAGSLHLQLDIAGNRLTFTENLVTLDNVSRLMTKVENLVVTDSFINVLAPGAFTEAVNGRVYDSVHGYVDITTPMPFSFSASGQEFPSSGQLVLRGANNASVRATALSQSLVAVSLDLDGNSVYETNATLKWTDLGTAVASDLGDADGDGMHNSWETANGFNPNDPADAAGDADGDGISNLAEYQGGSDPRNRLSLPVP